MKKFVLYAAIFAGLSTYPLNFDNDISDISKFIKPLSAAAVQLDLEETIREAEENVRKNPNAKNYAFLSQSYFLNKDFKKAEETAKKCLQLNPDLWHCNNNLGLSYMETKQFDKAEESFKKALEDVTWRHMTHFNLATLFFRQGQFEKALVYSTYAAEYAAKNQPNFFPPYITMGMSHYNLKEFEKARAAFIRALSIDSSNEEAKKWLKKMNEEKLGVPSPKKPSRKKDTKI